MSDLRCACGGLRCALTADDKRHGTANGYGNLNCRCDPCRGAWTLTVRQVRARRRTRKIPDHVHGTAGGYGNYGCRCRGCTTAWADDSTERAHRRRRGQTLVAQGLMAKPQRRSA